MKTMTWMKIGVAVLTMTACGETPLTDRVEKLEAKVEELEASQEQQQQELLARLDQISVTAENAAEVAEVRTKLAQTGISNSEFQLCVDVSKPSRVWCTTGARSSPDIKGRCIPYSTTSGTRMMISNI